MDTARWKGDAQIGQGRPAPSEVATSTLLLAADRAGVGQGRPTVEAGSTAIGRPHPEPGIPNLVIVHRRVIGLSAEPESVRSQPANRRKQRI